MRLRVPEALALGAVVACLLTLAQRPATVPPAEGPRFSVKWHPCLAHGDGVHDDGPAIECGIREARRLSRTRSLQTGSWPHVTGATTYVPAGEYLVSQKLVVPEDTALVGASRYNTWVGGAFP